MIKLSRLTDYGVVVMSQMAQDMTVTRTTPELAAATGVPAPTVAKLLKLLVKGGLVESWRGVNGGYALTRKIDEITAADIIEALEAHDADLAERLVREHTLNLAAHVEKNVDFLS